MRIAACLLLVGAVLAPVCAAADVNPFIQMNLLPSHDTYATHNDKSVHGFDPTIKVGIEPQECFTSGWNPCEDLDMVCCEDTPDYNFCAVEGQCASTPPAWEAFRKFHGYIRFDLTDVPTDAKVVSASLRLQQMDKVEALGGPAKVEVYRLKKIGLGDAETCEWSEATLNDTNGTTWSALPQNVSITPEGVWAFDVTKAVQDWLEGDTDLLGAPIAPNCGFHLYDPDFGKKNAPIQRWVHFSSKEGGFPSQLTITFAQDLDGDGWYGDCNEEDPEVHPDAIEQCNQADDDCDGMKDEEDCDGVDNDCDGEIDEGEDLCGSGMACIFHQCVVTCEDDCDGPYDLKCAKNDADVWEKYGCKNADDDPCLDWYMAQPCDANEFCQLGYCAFNCVDLCEPEELGTKSCQETSTGKHFVATCDDWDADGCLEWGNEEWCGPGATCANAACSGGCQDSCPELAQTVCEDDGLAVSGCYDSNGDGCLEWTPMGGCDPDLSVCEDGDCQPTAPACEDECPAGLTQCKPDDAGESAVSSCVEDADADPCLEWSTPSACEFGCNDDSSDCAPKPQTEDVYEDVVSPDVIDGELISADLAEDLPKDTGESVDVPSQVPQDGVMVLDVTADEDKDASGGSGGCSSSPASGVPASPFLLVFALVAVGAIFRRFATAR